MTEPVLGVFVPARGAAHRSSRALSRHVGAAGLTRVWRGVYLRREDRDDVAARLRALEQSVGVPLLACHATAAALHGFDVTSDPRLHVTTVDGRSLRRRPGLVLHQMRPRSEPAVIGGVMVVAAADAAVDLACSVPESDVLAVLDAAMRCDVTADVLTAALDGAVGRRAIRQVRSWAPYADWRAESPMESRTRQLMITAGFPPPDLQVEVRTRAGSSRYLDCGWRRYRTGVDYDGQQAHAGAGERDRQRHNDVANMDWQMYYPTAPDVYLRPRRFLAMVAESLVRRGYRGGFGRRASPDLLPRPASGLPSRLLRLRRSAWSSEPRAS